MQLKSSAEKKYCDPGKSRHFSLSSNSSLQIFLISAIQYVWLPVVLCQQPDVAATAQHEITEPAAVADVDVVGTVAAAAVWVF